MRRITWPVRRGHFFSKIFEIPDPICLFSMQPPRLYDLGKWMRYLPNSVRLCVKGECDVSTCAKSRDLSVGGRKQVHFWNLRPRYAYSLYNFYGATVAIKGRLYSRLHVQC